MHTQKRFAAKLAGVILAAVVATMGLTACGSASAGSVNEAYLVPANVNQVTCGSVGNDASALETAAAFVKDANAKTTQDILGLKGNGDLTTLEPLSTALTAKITEIKACSASSDGSTAKPASDTTTALSPELKALLDASSAPMINCVDIVTQTGGAVVNDTYSLFVKALLGVDANNANLRQWSDALSTPLAGASPEEMRTWVNRAICEEPLIGVSLAHLFAHLEVSGVSILDLQTTDWLKPFAVDASEIDTLTAQYATLEVWKLQNPGATPTDEQYSAALAANHEYRALASKLVFLLSRYQLAGVSSINSTHHYHLVAGGLRADGIPEVEISAEVDSRPALVFYLTEKTACKPISVLGFNTGDKRPMLGNVPNTCEELIPPTTTTPGTPGTPGTPSTPSTPPTCVTNCKKDWSLNTRKPDGVTSSLGSGELTGTPAAPAAPAPVAPAAEAPSSGSGAIGATTPDPARESPAPGTGTTSDGQTGSVNPTAGPNNTDTGNPFSGS